MDATRAPGAAPLTWQFLYIDQPARTAAVYAVAMPPIFAARFYKPKRRWSKSPP